MSTVQEHVVFVENNRNVLSFKISLNQKALETLIPETWKDENFLERLIEHARKISGGNTITNSTQTEQTTVVTSEYANIHAIQSLKHLR